MVCSRLRGLYGPIRNVQNYLELVGVELASLDPVRLLLSQLWQAMPCGLEGGLLRVHGSRGRLAQGLLLALPQLPVQA